MSNPTFNLLTTTTRLFKITFLFLNYCILISLLINKKEKIETFSSLLLLTSTLDSVQIIVHVQKFSHRFANFRLQNYLQLKMRVWKIQPNPSKIQAIIFVIYKQDVINHPKNSKNILLIWNVKLHQTMPLIPSMLHGMDIVKSWTTLLSMLFLTNICPTSHMLFASFANFISFKHHYCTVNKTSSKMHISSWSPFLFQYSHEGCRRTNYCHNFLVVSEIWYTEELTSLFMEDRLRKALDYPKIQEKLKYPLAVLIQQMKHPQKLLDNLTLVTI